MRELTAGDVLDQYRLGELLARSGMASIFKATDTESSAPVALKIPHMQFESDVVFFERFKREENIGQKLDHPHIVKVLKPRAKSRMYLAMEYVEGKSLRAIMQAAGKLPVEQALDVAQQVGDALCYLHGRKVVHRDLKPENVLVTAAGQVKILDFGIALDETARRLTWAGRSSAVGTPDYMAPEQIGGRRGDERTDVYALGTMVFEMLAGDLPHEAPNPQALLSAKTSDDPRPLSYFLPSVDPALDAVVVRSIQRSPRDRYQTVAQFLTDLRDPKAAAHADGSRRTTPARRRFGAVRRVAVPLVVVMIFGGLIALVALSHRAAPPLAPTSPAAHREK
jgi:serine/threonine-protein kinase